MSQRQEFAPPPGFAPPSGFMETKCYAVKFTYLSCCGQQLVKLQPNGGMESPDFEYRLLVRCSCCGTEAWGSLFLRPPMDWTNIPCTRCRWGGYVILYPNSNPIPMKDDRFGCGVQVPAIFVNIACRGYEPLKLDMTKTCWELHTCPPFVIYPPIKVSKDISYSKDIPYGEEEKGIFFTDIRGDENEFKGYRISVRTPTLFFHLYNLDASFELLSTTPHRNMEDAYKLKLSLHGP